MRLRKHSLLGFLVLGWVSTFMLVHVASSANLSPDLQRYVGTWQAQFKDTTFVVLRLREQNSKLGGTVVHATHVQADPKGELLAVDITNVEDKIVEAHATKDKLIFNIAESADQGNLVQCELTMTAKDAGQLQMIVPAPGSQFKPWRINRISRNTR